MSCHRHRYLNLFFASGLLLSLINRRLKGALLSKYARRETNGCKKKICVGDSQENFIKDFFLLNEICGAYTPAGLLGGGGCESCDSCMQHFCAQDMIKKLSFQVNRRKGSCYGQVPYLHRKLRGDTVSGCDSTQLFAGPDTH